MRSFHCWMLDSPWQGQREEEGEKAAEAEFKKKVEEMGRGVPLLLGKLEGRQTH